MNSNQEVMTGEKERENVTINCVKWIFQTAKFMAFWAWGSGLFKAQGKMYWAKTKNYAWIKMLLSEHKEKVIHEPLHSKCSGFVGNIIWKPLKQPEWNTA